MFQRCRWRSICLCLIPVAPELAGCLRSWINCLVSAAIRLHPCREKVMRTCGIPQVFFTSHCPHLDKALLVPGCYRVVTLVLLLWPSTHQWSTLWCSCPCLCLFSLCLFQAGGLPAGRHLCCPKPCLLPPPPLASEILKPLQGDLEPTELGSAWMLRSHCSALQSAVGSDQDLAN